MKRSIAIFAIAYSGVCAAFDATSFVELEVGPSTYKSQMVESNDTSFMMGFKGGITGGVQKEIDMLVQYNTATTAFKYADSSAKSSIGLTFFDTKIRYALGPTYLGLVFGRSHVLSTLRSEKYLNSMASGYGATAGMVVETARGGSVFLDLTYATMTSTIDALQNPNDVKVSVGGRTDITLGGTMRVGKAGFVLRLAYLQRSLALSVGGKSFPEVQTATLIGLGWNLK